MPSDTPLGDLRLILLDRDGVINLDSPDYIKHPDEWHAIEGSIAAIVRLQASFQVAVCTNQSGIGRGLFDIPTLDAMHDKLCTLLRDAGGQAVDVFYCPHVPDAGCDCRKPRPGLLLEAMRNGNAQPQQSVYVGDSEKDLLAATHAGCLGALVLTGSGQRTRNTPAGRAARWVFEDLTALADVLAPKRPG